MLQPIKKQRQYDNTKQEKMIDQQRPLALLLLQKITVMPIVKRLDLHLTFGVAQRNNQITYVCGQMRLRALRSKRSYPNHLMACGEGCRELRKKHLHSASEPGGRPQPKADTGRAFFFKDYLREGANFTKDP